MQFDIRSNVRDVSRWLDDAQKKQVPFATIYAMTLTARDVREEEISVMKRVFDRPTPYTLNALKVVPATKQTKVASVEFKEFGGTPAKRFLNPNVHGGPRSRKSHERQIAPFMAGKMFTAQAKGAPTNAYGNITGGTYTRILSQLKVSSDPTQRATGSRRSAKKRKTSAYFVNRKNTAVMERKGKTVKPILVFTKAPRYRKRFPFYDTAQRVVRDKFNVNFEAAFQRTMANSGYRAARGSRWRF